MVLVQFLLSGLLSTFSVGLPSSDNLVLKKITPRSPDAFTSAVSS